MTVAPHRLASGFSRCHAPNSTLVGISAPHVPNRSSMVLNNTPRNRSSSVTEAPAMNPASPTAPVYEPQPFTS